MKFRYYLLEGIKVYLDDERKPPKGWKLVKTPKDVIKLIEKGNVDEVSLDHDLGDDQGIGTGYDVIKWIEEKVYTDEKFSPPKIKIHTANSSARIKMEAGLKSIMRKIK